MGKKKKKKYQRELLMSSESRTCWSFVSKPFIVDAFYFIHQENMSMKSILLESNFYIEKLGFAGVYLSFLFWLQNIDCGYSLEPPHTHKHCIVHNEEILYI